MKTIKVNDEMYEFLMSLSKEINEQDNRATAMPYFFQVQEKKQFAVPNGCGIEAWHLDGSLLDTDDEIKEAVFEFKEWDIDSDEDNEKYQNLNELDIEEIMEVNYSKVNYDYDEVYSNCFLTSKACDEHIRINRHNLKQPVNYLSHAYRNKEMEMIYKFLTGLTSGELHK